MKLIKVIGDRLVLIGLLLMLAVTQAGAVDYKPTRVHYVGRYAERVQTGYQNSPVAAAPQAMFQSTRSAIVTSGSSFSSNPVIGADGTASGVGSLAVGSSEENLRSDWVIEPGEDDEEFPLGDAALPLMLLACAYLIRRVTHMRA